MSDEKYDVVFTGELVRSFELAAVKRNLGQLFKIRGAQLEALFSGKFVVLKRDLDFDTATKYRVAIKKAGARVDLIPAEPTIDEASLRPVAAKSAGQNGGESSSENVVPFGDDAMTLAPAGADVLNDSEKRAEVASIVDIPDYSLREAVGEILDPEEKPYFAPFSSSALNADFDLAPVGEELLSATERREVPYPDIDLSGFSVASLGERLSEPRQQQPPPPDVSGLSLEALN